MFEIYYASRTQFHTAQRSLLFIGSIFIYMIELSYVFLLNVDSGDVTTHV